MIKGKDGLGAGVEARLDAITAIRDITATDALFIMRDGAQQRISLVTDFRVLYFTTPSGATEKLDLAKIQSIEFLEPSGNRQGSS